MAEKAAERRVLIVIQAMRIATVASLSPTDRNTTLERVSLLDDLRSSAAIIGQTCDHTWRLHRRGTVYCSAPVFLERVLELGLEVDSRQGVLGEPLIAPQTIGQVQSLPKSPRQRVTSQQQLLTMSGL